MTAAATSKTSHVPLKLETPEATEALGPLAGLVGTWSGIGWNLIAVPNGTGGFKLLVNEIDETITFTPIEALVPNRSNGGGTMLLAGVQYDIKVTDAAEGPNKGNLLHAENGMWLWPTNMAPTPGADTATDEIFTPITVVRIATVPHGNSVVAIGPFENDRRSAGYSQYFLAPDPDGRSAFRVYRCLSDPGWRFPPKFAQQVPSGRH